MGKARNSIERLKEKIISLKHYIRERQKSGEGTLDFLIKNIQGVFAKQTETYFVVKTISPTKTFTVSFQNMSTYFPKTLIEHL